MEEGEWKISEVQFSLEREGRIFNAKTLQRLERILEGDGFRNRESIWMIDMRNGPLHSFSIQQMLTRYQALVLGGTWGYNNKYVNQNPCPQGIYTTVE